MANMPASYPYSMLGYGYPPAYLQLSGYTQQQLAGILGAQNLASLGGQNLASLGGQNLASLGAQNWATAAVAANTAAVGAQQAYTSSKQGYPVIAPMAAAAVANGSPKLCYPGSAPLAAAATTNFDKSSFGCGRTASQVPAPADPAAVQQEVGGGEGGEEFLQELIKERDAIETSSSSSLSKTHILRLLNKGKYSTVGYSIETIAPPAASPRPIFSGLSIKVNILDIP